MNKLQLIASFDEYVTAMNESLGIVRELLDAEDYEGACQAMTSISMNQARVSVQMQANITRMKQ